MGKKKKRRNAKAEELLSIRMMPRDWLKRLYDSKEDVRR